ncbi:hypothetical protein [Methanoculleus sp.]|jgi:hypothetical protein|uniref:hypothetical protein n=1 Tax=Methanoculleus sp. TaxID=90427 RepID=UPI001BD53D74|nr:hypothetical protein [Methanoculleus sp.]MDK2989411.1 hypothetical protein [Methanoculleus sp.]
MEIQELQVLLQYAASTSPSPMQASVPWMPATGRLNISLLNPQGAYCKQIIVAVPYGNTPDSLFASMPSIAANNADWSLLTKEEDAGGRLGIRSATPYAAFTMVCRDEKLYKISGNQTFSIFGDISGQCGSSTIQIQETSSPDNQQEMQDRLYQFNCVKGEPEFYANNFITTAADQYTVPRSEFQKGEKIRFAWESNGTYFKLYQKDGKVVYQGTQTSCVLQEGVQNDTAFVLVASMTGDWDEDQPQAGYRSVYIYRHLTVTVANPVLQPSFLTVGEWAVFSGPAAFVQKTEFKEHAKFSGGANISGGLNVNTSLYVNGNLTAIGATVEDSLHVKGELTAASATIQHSLETHGANIHIDLFHQDMHTVCKGPNPYAYYQADADGFLVVNIACSEKPGQSIAQCTVQVINFCYLVITNIPGNDENTYSGSNSGMIPVKRNQEVLITGRNYITENKSEIEVLWIPIGDAAPKREPRC